MCQGQEERRDSLQKMLFGLGTNQEETMGMVPGLPRAVFVHNHPVSPSLLHHLVMGKTGDFLCSSKIKQWFQA